MANKAGLKIFFELLLKPFDIPQNRTLPPDIMDAIINTSAAWVIDNVVSLWPHDQSYVDIIEPFLRTEAIRVKDGFVPLPEQYRNFLDCGAYVTGDFSGNCSGIESQDISNRGYNQAISKKGCVRQAIRIVDQSEWDYMTQSEFDNPTLKAPIGCFFGGRKIKICPAEIHTVEIRYLVTEKIYRYGYIMQPDDTFIFDEKTSVECEFLTPAFSHLYKAAATLIGVYFQDGSIANFAQALQKVNFK